MITTNCILDNITFITNKSHLDKVIDKLIQQEVIESKSDLILDSVRMQYRLNYDLPKYILIDCEYQNGFIAPYTKTITAGEYLQSTNQFARLEGLRNDGKVVRVAGNYPLTSFGVDLDVMIFTPFYLQAGDRVSENVRIVYANGKYNSDSSTWQGIIRIAEVDNG